MPHNHRVSEQTPPEQIPSSTVLDAPRLPKAGRGREGYSPSEVDAFVTELQRALGHQPPTMAPYEVEDQRFTVVRLTRGYDMRHVDDYLDAAVSQLRERHGADAVALVEGREPEAPRQVRTWWIYLVALVLVVAIVAFALSVL